MTTSSVTIEYCAYADLTYTVVIQLDLVHNSTDLELCERIFTATGTYGEQEPDLWALISEQLPTPRSHTALSVGDRITIDDTTYECQPIGFADITSAPRHHDI